VTHDDSGVQPWIERAASLVQYRDEADSFITRASANLPTDPEDAEAVCLLWTEADGLDRKVSAYFTAMNDALLDGRGRLDVTRGADVSRGSEERDSLVYQCTWAFQWDEVRDISLVLAIEPRSKHFNARVAAAGAEAVALSVPIDDARLEDALAIAYYRAATGSTGG